MRALLYDANGHDRELSVEELGAVSPGRSSLLWVTCAPGETQRTKLPRQIAAAVETYDPELNSVRVHDEFYQLTVPVAAGADGSAQVLGLLVGSDWLVSLGEGVAVDFADFVEHDVGETMKGKLSGSTLAAALLREHFARFHRKIAAIDAEVDRVEERILRAREGRNTLQVLAVLRRKVARLRDLLTSYRPVIHALTRPDFLPELDNDDRKHLLHLEAGYERLEDEVVRVRDTVVGSFDLYSSRVAQDTNRLLRTLTFVTIGIGVVGALAVVFGMNFKAKVFDTGETGFHIATWTMAAILLITTIVAAVTYRRP